MATVALQRTLLNRICITITICFICSSQVVAEPVLRLSVGGVATGQGDAIAEALVKSVDNEVDAVTLVYDNTVNAAKNVPGRLIGQGHLPDIVYLYIGSLEVLDELSALVREGRLQPIDGLPGYEESLQPEDIYPNLLRPVSSNGHVWAVPVRVSPPILVIRQNVAKPVTRWDDMVHFIEGHSFSPCLDTDYYYLWLSLASQRGSTLESANYSTKGGVFSESFEKVLACYRAEQVGKPHEADVCFASADSLTDYPQLLSNRKYLALPGGETSSIYGPCSGWYLGVSAELSGPARRAASKVLGAFLGMKTQLALAELTNAPPVRISVAQNVSFALICEEKPWLKILSETVPRLCFSFGGKELALTEPMFEAALTNALKKPESYEDIMDGAAASAKATLEEKSDREAQH